MVIYIMDLIPVSPQGHSPASRLPGGACRLRGGHWGNNRRRTAGAARHGVDHILSVPSALNGIVAMTIVDCAPDFTMSRFGPLVRTCAGTSLHPARRGIERHLMHAGEGASGRLFIQSPGKAGIHPPRSVDPAFSN